MEPGTGGAESAGVAGTVRCYVRFGVLLFPSQPISRVWWPSWVDVAILDNAWGLVCPSRHLAELTAG